MQGHSRTAADITGNMAISGAAPTPTLAKGCCSSLHPVVRRCTDHLCIPSHAMRVILAPWEAGLDPGGTLAALGGFGTWKPAALLAFRLAQKQTTL